jgi:hypothetical protein
MKVPHHKIYWTFLSDKPPYRNWPGPTKCIFHTLFYCLQVVSTLQNSVGHPRIRITKMHGIQLKHASFIVSHFDTTRFPSSAQDRDLARQKNMAAPMVAAILWHLRWFKWIGSLFLFKSIAFHLKVKFAMYRYMYFSQI